MANTEADAAAAYIWDQMTAQEAEVLQMLRAELWSGPLYVVNVRECLAEGMTRDDIRENSEPLYLPNTQKLLRITDYGSGLIVSGDAYGPLHREAARIVADLPAVVYVEADSGFCSDCEPQAEVCDTCQGSGVYAEDADDAEDAEADDAAECPDCGGCGEWEPGDYSQHLLRELLPQVREAGLA